MGGGTEDAHREYRDSYTRPFLSLEGGVKRGLILRKQGRERGIRNYITRSSLPNKFNNPSLVFLLSSSLAFRGESLYICLEEQVKNSLIPRMADSVYPPWRLEHATDTASLGA